ncbi:DUF368 domain-containing protein [Waddlia chondrophila]|uniref:Conserved putative membrane protein n=1 Tax=Waddlia chondrophila (strain ATCC VR-1470 / WSU 86-1044) TaxID=716544 RepID=D6YVG2_WADCW|nr:DUF368 domain-containing protein [Waddlia chondrophila]ADI38123.1 conserved putative membrane protein [Waddlia chondrophila WSU 86-1044]
MTVKSGKDWYRLFFYGACMGAADLVPGVSGGTMALICGIYEELIVSIKSFGTVDALSLFWLDFKRFNQKVGWKFLLTVLLGILFSLVIFSRAIHFMLGDPVWRTYLYALFLGMILSSIVICIWRVPGWSKRLWWGLAVGAASTLFFTGFRSEPLLDQQTYQVKLPFKLGYQGDKQLVNYDKETGLLKGLDAQILEAMWAKGYLNSDSMVAEQSSQRLLRLGDLMQKGEESWFDPWLFFCGAIAVSAMLLPGISGSFLLMILGAYPVVIAALAELVKGWTAFTWDGEAFTVLINLSLGIGAGAVIFSRAIDWFLKKDHDLTIAVLIGFMVGSLRVVWPYRTYAWGLDPLKLKNGPQLIPEGFYQPSIWDAMYWKSAIFMVAGLGIVFLIYTMSENVKKR